MENFMTSIKRESLNRTSTITGKYMKLYEHKISLHLHAVRVQNIEVTDQSPSITERMEIKQIARHTRARPF